ncbi:hypothetical protein [Martelella endophytica]|uniref:Uncharacterized protein n=1 Tax=Martelella endophytica TaxID=1486262 RepID=A0A0D5LRB9_MAREN|nr:hypothetical protein [Martelella endophytica]AJY46470.1 hypothetical protein TM49_13535 [Martelella endophytica]
MSQGDTGDNSQKFARSDEEREAWNRYMRNFRRGFKQRGLTSLSTVITVEHADFIDQYGRARGCQSKREALMMIIDDVKKRFETEGDQDA